MNHNKSAAHGSDLPGAVVTAVFAFVLGLIFYGPLVAFELNNSFFEHFSINYVVGSWTIAVKYVSSVIFSILSGFAYYFALSKRDLKSAARLLLALLLGVMGMVGLALIISFFLIILAMLAGILALFFGPGDG
ncbi:MAG: hypothetical protein GY765_42545 [bacterium]|nr:hypothetical protein [bacterium]